MNHDLSYYRKIQGTTGATSAKEAQIRQQKAEIDHYFEMSQDCEDTKINGTDQKLAITKSTDLAIKHVVSKPDESLYMGDIITWNSTDWIVDTLDADTRINSKGKMRRCNVTLKWLDEGNTIRSYSGFCEAVAGEGVISGNMLQVNDSTIRVKIHLDEHSAKINRDKRFLLDVVQFLPQMEATGSHPSAYIVTRRNVLTGFYNGHGYVELTMVETAYSENDNPTLMLADYYSADDEYVLTISNADENLTVAKGSTYTLSCSATKNGVAINQTSILFQSSNTAIATVSTAGVITGVANGTCIVTVKEGNVKQEITITVKDVADRVVVSSESGAMDVIYGETVKLIARAFENGQENTAATFTFQIGADTPYVATIDSYGDNYVVIKSNNDSSLVGEIINVVVNTYGSTTIHPITIRGWF